ncbi:MAG: hypothetical protein R3E08_08825 [Thiotrichaceae bacterium]
MTDEKLRERVASLAVAQKETDKQQNEIDKLLKILAEQIGGLDNKFGSFTEGWAFPSMVKLLREHFKMESVATNYQIKRGGKIMELDVFAHSNGELNTAYIVEVKSHLREEHIEQLLQQLNSLREFLPAHANKKLYGILAGVNIPEQVKQKVLQQGLYLAVIHDEHFKLQVPKSFQVKAF